MKLFLLLVAFPSVALAGPQEDLAAARGDVPKLYTLVTSTEASLRPEAEFLFASALRAQKLPFCSFVFIAPILKAGEKHPFYLQAIEQLVQVQAELNDDYLIPSLLAKWDLPLERLTPASRSRALYLKARLALRQGKLEEVISLVDAIPPAQAVFSSALYLKAIALSDPRRNNGTAVPEAIAVLKQIVESKDSSQVVRGLATLALGRLAYGSGDFAGAVGWYSRARAFPRVRSEAVFEVAFAQWHSDDIPGALVSARASDVPEAALLESQILYFSKRNAEALKALDRMPTSRPRPTARSEGLSGLVAEVEREKAFLRTPDGWSGSPMSRELIGYLEQNRGTLMQVKDKTSERLVSDATKNDAIFRDHAEIMRFEIALSEGGNVDPAISSLEKIVERIPDGAPVKAELLFHLAELHREKASQLGEPRWAAAAPLAEANRLLDLVLKDYPAYERLAEVRAARDLTK